MPNDSDGTSKGWEIFESEEYALSVSQCGSHQFFDEALGPIMHGLNRNPLGFEQVSPGIYIAKTKLKISGGEIIPAYNLWFRADEAINIVCLLWVEIAPPETMGLWDDDDIPF